MSHNLLAEFEIGETSVCATIIDRDELGRVMEGEGDCVLDAVAAALHDPRIAFASERDDRDACVAAMRARRLSFRLTNDGRLFSLGFA